MEKAKKLILSLLREAVENLGVVIETIQVSHPGEFGHGDYYTNIALVSAKKNKVAPLSFANRIKVEIEKNGLPSEITRIEIAHPGFINFFLAPSYFKEEIAIINNDPEHYGKSAIYQGKKILVEHSSPNLFKPFHVGHVMNNAVGEAVTRLAKFSGAEVAVISYPSDISLGIGKAVWAMVTDGASKVDSYQTLDEKIKYLGECYVRGTRAYEDDSEVAAQVRLITQKLFNKLDCPEYNLYEKAKQINLLYFKESVKTLGSTFDAFIFENEAGKEGEQIVKKYLGTVFNQSEGAVIYSGEKDGLHSRVFINKDGNPTYEAKDIGLLSLKFSRYNPDISIFITDSEQTSYFQVVAAAAEKINPDWKEKTIHRTHGRMSFKGEKMSSRLGGVPLASELLNMVREEISQRINNLPDVIVDQIGVAALKFTILRVATGKNMNFDPETSLSLEGDSGPYIQYTLVRALSVVRKASEQLSDDADEEQVDHVIISEVERMLIRFPEVIELSISEWSPHHLALYLVELSRSFNRWYGNTKIIDIANPKFRYNVAITQATSSVLKNGLSLLGIESPSQM